MTQSFTTKEILRKQEQTVRIIETARDVLGEAEAEMLCAGYVIGAVNYLTKYYGSRRAYDAVQQIADCIPELPSDKN